MFLIEPNCYNLLVSNIFVTIFSRLAQYFSSMKKTGDNAVFLLMCKCNSPSLSIVSCNRKPSQRLFTYRVFENTQSIESISLLGESEDGNTNGFVAAQRSSDSNRGEVDISRRNLPFGVLLPIILPHPGVIHKDKHGIELCYDTYRSKSGATNKGQRLQWCQVDPQSGKLLV